jgi:hypothetical protein
MFCFPGFSACSVSLLSSERGRSCCAAAPAAAAGCARPPAQLPASRPLRRQCTLPGRLESARGSVQPALCTPCVVNRARERATPGSRMLRAKLRAAPVLLPGPLPWTPSRQRARKRRWCGEGVPGTHILSSPQAALAASLLPGRLVVRLGMPAGAGIEGAQPAAPPRVALLQDGPLGCRRDPGIGDGCGHACVLVARARPCASSGNTDTSPRTSVHGPGCPPCGGAFIDGGGPVFPRTWQARGRAVGGRGLSPMAACCVCPPLPLSCAGRPPRWRLAACGGAPLAFGWFPHPTHSKLCAGHACCCY